MQVCEFSNFDKNRRNFDQNSRNIYQTKFIRPDSFEFKPILLIFIFQTTLNWGIYTILCLL